MRSILVFIVTCAVAFAAGSCSRHGPRARADQGGQTKIDACTLLSKDEIQTLQQSPIRDTKSSERADGDFRVAQCFYTAAEFNKSVSLAVVQKHPTDPRRRTPKQFWQKTFGRSAEKKEKGEKESGEEKERRTPPKKIEGVGDDAYWASNRFGGVLYVLKGDAFISISVGGPDKEETKINKSKALAEKALQRL